MEGLPEFGTAIIDVIPGTAQIYQPLLDEKAEAIRSTRKETFQYGANPRQMLDVYHPPGESNTSSPILIFFYGGGFVRGARLLSEGGLVYANVGHFFSKLGYTTIIPDYRLVPEAKFPSGGEDVLGSLEWAETQFGRNKNIYLMGASAGGVHISTFLLADDFASKRSQFIRSVGGIKGCVLLSAPFSFHEANALRGPVLEAYYGSEIEGHSPAGLLKGLGKAANPFSVPVLSFTCSLDPVDEILKPSNGFYELYSTVVGGTGGGIFETRTIEGHNHVSPAWALGTSKEADESWAVGAHEWMKSVVAKN